MAELTDDGRDPHMAMAELTDEQIERQDFVDNAIFELLVLLNPSEREIEWDREIISDIRDTIEYWFVRELQITDDASFYPYVEE